MAFENYDLVFAPVLPAIRPEHGIIADMAGAEGDGGESRRQVAKIEFGIAQGDAAHRQKKHYAALSAFKEARAEIYKILYPGFDAGAYVLDLADYILPVSAAIERNLVDASIETLSVIRPEAVEERPVLEHLVDVALDQELLPLTHTGYRESSNIEEKIQLASDRGIALLHGAKAEDAFDVMEGTLAQATQPGVRADPALLAALELNMTGAALQIGDTDKAEALAEASLEHFEQSKNDIVGQAQALHLAAIAAQEAGNTQQANELFRSASATLERATLPTTTRPVVLDGHARIGSFASRDPNVLKPIANGDGTMLTVRTPGRVDGWGSLPLNDDLQKRQLAKSWEVGVRVGDESLRFEVGGGMRPARDEIIAGIYEARVSPSRFANIRWTITEPSTTIFYLTHLYAYALLVKIGDAFHALGQYEQAESNYREAAKYSYLNEQVEASTLWTRLARNTIEWGHALYKAENLPGAREQYSKLIAETGTVPDSFLYTTPSLSVPADDARTLIQNLSSRPLPPVNWEIALFVLTAQQHLQQIMDGLDFYGLTLSPIHTFEYLQGVARGFAQEAVQAEREFVNFKTREEAEEATRRDLEATKAMAEAEADARFQQYVSAQEDESAAQNAHELAIRRRDDAQQQRDLYASTSSAQIWAQAAAAALGGGEDAYWGEISELADRLDRGETITGPGPKLAAAQILRAGRKTRAYELQKMQDMIDELTQAINVAKDQWDAAKRRTAAAEIAWQAALQRAQMADAALDAFDDEFFTPESWNKMADVIRDIARSYLFRAIRIAKLMERAYNFENDTELKVVKNEYGHGVANPGPGRDVMLFGGDSLLKDVDSFTYHAITTKTRKSSQIKDVISVSADFAAQFEQFRQTGVLELETDLYEFDRLHPGFYGQRVEAVDVEIVGVLPEEGLNGTLTLGGVTRYRKKDGTAAERVHQVDTMALSDFVLRNDAFVYRAETGVRGLFQGFGLGTTWALHLPRRSNDFDFRRIFDVQLVIYYTARFDAALRTSVLQAPLRPDELARLRTYGLRYDFPDAWYGFYQDGIARFNLDRFRLPMNQKDFASQSVSFRVVTANGVTGHGIDLRVTAPDGASGTATTDASGLVSTEDPALASLIGIDPLGAWQLEVVGGAPITDDGQLRLDRIYNIQIGLEYTFVYVEEVA